MFLTLQPRRNFCFYLWEGKINKKKNLREEEYGQFCICYILNGYDTSKQRHQVRRWIYESGLKNKFQDQTYKFGRFNKANGMNEITHGKSLGRNHNEALS